jgi:hypothetical protein
VIGTTVPGAPTAGKAANTQSIGEPSGLALDANGNLYISDRYNCAIYKVDTSGIVTLVAGYNTNGGAAFFSGQRMPWRAKPVQPYPDGIIAARLGEIARIDAEKQAKRGK